MFAARLDWGAFAHSNRNRDLVQPCESHSIPENPRLYHFKIRPRLARFHATQGSLFSI